MVRLAAAIVATMSTVAALLMFGAVGVATASPPNVTGEKYSAATAAISGAGLRTVVSTTIGDQMARPDCLVANQQQRTVPPPENSAGASVSEVLVSLNCDAAAASAKAPGYSAASPEGRAIAAAAKATAQNRR